MLPRDGLVEFMGEIEIGAALLHCQAVIALTVPSGIAAHGAGADLRVLPAVIGPVDELMVRRLWPERRGCEESIGAPLDAGSVMTAEGS